MLAPSQDSPLAEFKNAIQNTRAKYYSKIVRLWEQVQRSPDNELLRFTLARQLEPYVREAEENPPIILDHRELDFEVWQGAYNLDLSTHGKLVIIAGGARSVNSALLGKICRGE